MTTPVLPKRIKVRHHYYRIIFHDSLIPHGDGKARGTCDPTNRVINISKKQTRRLVISTFLHELLHAIEFEYRIKLAHQTIHELELPLAQVFIQNAALRRYVKIWKR